MHRLVEEEHIHTRDIILLTPRFQDNTALQEGLALGKFRLTFHPLEGDQHVQVSSIQDFKGLDRRVVIVAEVDNVASHDLASLLYVACSRARTHLLILLDADSPSYVKENIYRYIEA
jgi:superfamily I DNA/RNA helicase